MTTKEKIDQALGVSCGKSMDQMLDELNVDSGDVTKMLDGFDTTATAAFDEIEKKGLEIQAGVGNGVLAISDMTASLKQVEELIANSREVFKHIAENITSSDLIDSELVASYSHLLESIHLNIAEFISIYKQKSKFVEKVKLMILQQQQRIELANLRHKQNLELLEAKKKEPEAVDAEGEGLEFDTDRVMKSMSKSGAFDFLTNKQETVRFEESNGQIGDEIRIEDEPDDDEEDSEEDEDGKPKKKKR